MQQMRGGKYVRRVLCSIRCGLSLQQRLEPTAEYGLGRTHMKPRVRLGVWIPLGQLRGDNCRPIVKCMQVYAISGMSQRHSAAAAMQAFAVTTVAICNCFLVFLVFFRPGEAQSPSSFCTDLDQLNHTYIGLRCDKLS